MLGKAWNDGTCQVTYEPSNGDKLLSPDSSQQLLPCEGCGCMKWVLKNAVSFVCSVCQEELDTLGYTTGKGAE